ncbi:uroporphyrinogen-III C-methyltransferase [Alkalihalobacillus pseudalcaliphilus]|uniref:uroporphyrinogen-III C-methyltransferase n=1 Tax=Alkalihalobacillus pseudalcaliphilus TaxID=79884 RepID=UPI00064DC088|nr:uroporphyrinogen-III C-methyltransferase [Alkalihalobacillus pseudalcaliphilus]KMK76056.1 methyltransferase [Alkalihalobacillus pseudalcaliphilus]
MDEDKKGVVYLVGAGPGDTELLTLKGYRVLRQADVVIYDRLVHPLFLEWTKPNCELIYGGKLPDRHFLRQETIQDLLIEYAIQGKCVVRLKGGDPSVFGRVAEEASALREAGIQFEVVPGITAGIGAATYAGMSVTHRDYSSSFAVVTGHNQSVSGEPTVDWQALTQGVDTIAFYMGVKNLPFITEQLLKHGANPEKPVSLIQWATTGKQRVVSGNLTTIVAKVKAAQIQNPAIALVGDINQLRQEKSWFEEKILFNQELLLAKAGVESGEMAAQLSSLGADVLEFPRYVIEPCLEGQVVDYQRYTQIVFMTQSSIEVFFESLRQKRTDIRMIHADFIVRNSKQADVLQQYGCQASLLQDVTLDNSGLLIGEEGARRKVPEVVSHFEYLGLYRKTVVPQSLITFQRMWEEERIEKIIFPNAKSVEMLTFALKGTNFTPHYLSEQTSIICFGPITSQKAESLGYQVTTKLKQPNVNELISHLSSEYVED